MIIRGTVALLVLAAFSAALPARAESPRDRALKLQKKLATDKNAEVRAESARTLGEMGAWDAVPALAKALEDPADEVRAASAGALVDLKEHARPAVPALEKALDDRYRSVRYNAVVALHNLDAATPAELGKAIASLLEGADDEKEMADVVDMLMDLGLDDPS